jgi:hypothetical protein
MKLIVSTSLLMANSTAFLKLDAWRKSTRGDEEEGEVKEEGR